ncbi:spore germination protein [Neobacillus sedimentimangrovi]|jgi:spore germination protein KA|uniref:Spore germination protein n=1 Tax=Neobacillus sedimentimangrovi TaxID=2699460 RepID=A0ABS8QF88_9BACI|nr:spore germination protein [Neobacillus sedimentimangrovi]MCD4837904.1 spore germination protein [Neobacillus sedimentimangrovi]
MHLNKHNTNNRHGIADDEITQENSPANCPNEERLRELFSHSSDVKFVPFYFEPYKVTLIYCTGLISSDFLYTTIPNRLETFFSQANKQPTKRDILEKLHLPTISVIETEEQAISELFAGKLFLSFSFEERMFSIDISDRPERKPEETKTEVAILGPRDNFIEDITVNIALIRKRLRTTSLMIDTLEVGRRTKTKVAILHIDDIADKEILQQIKDKISAIDIDGLFSGTQLEELINNNPYNLFPRYVYTGRPDYAAQSLLNGRFIILIDGVAYAYITPINLFFLLKSGEDKEFSYAFNSFQRIMRIVAVSVAAFLPGFWVALTSFHQNQIPLTFLATIVESRRGVPLSTAAEVLLMLLLFEVFREAGMRLPMAIGQTLSVIGGLIIGDAAIRAGLSSPATLVVIAGSTIATFTLLNQSLAGTISLVRFIVVIFVSFFGFFGFFLSIFLVGIYMANIRIFGVPYLGIATRLDAFNELKTIIRLPERKNMTRPLNTNPKDPTSRGGNSE